MAGGVFFWEGLLRFVYTNQGVGRFTKLGIPFPHFTATFVGALEIAGGMLLLSGLATRFIAVPFIAEMIVAMLTTKVSVFWNLSAATTSCAAQSRYLGCPARYSFRLRANHDPSVSSDQWTGSRVARRFAGASHRTRDRRTAGERSTQRRVIRRGRLTAGLTLHCGSRGPSSCRLRAFRRAGDAALCAALQLRLLARAGSRCGRRPCAGNLHEGTEGISRV